MGHRQNIVQTTLRNNIERHRASAKVPWNFKQIYPKFTRVSAMIIHI